MIIKPWNNLQIELNFALESSKSPLEIFLGTSLCKSCEKMNPRKSDDNSKIQLLYGNRVPHATQVKNIRSPVSRTNETVLWSKFSIHRIGETRESKIYSQA